MANLHKAPVPEINEGLEVYNNPDDPTVEYVEVHDDSKIMMWACLRMLISYHEF